MVGGREGFILPLCRAVRKGARERKGGGGDGAVMNGTKKGGREKRGIKIGLIGIRVRPPCSSSSPPRFLCAAPAPRRVER